MSLPVCRHVRTVWRRGWHVRKLSEMSISLGILSKHAGLLPTESDQLISLIIPTSISPGSATENVGRWPHGWCSCSLWCNNAERALGSNSSSTKDMCGRLRSGPASACAGCGCSSLARKGKRAMFVVTLRSVEAKKRKLNLFN